MIGSSVRVFLAVGPVDLRGAFNRLSAVTREVLRQDPMSGALYLFVNRRKNRVKALWWDRNGYTILYKRLSRGTFKIPALQAGSAYLEISPSDFSRLIAGLAISGEFEPGPTYH